MSTVVHVSSRNYISLVFAALLFLVIYACYYINEKNYAYKIKHKVTTNSMLSLASKLGVLRVLIELLYAKLAEGVDQIIAHFVRKYYVK